MKDKNKLKDYLKKHYDYDGNLPVPCHLCGSENIYAGNVRATSMGVQCNKCGLNLSVMCEQYNYGQHWRKKKDYMTLVLETAIKLWNKEITVDDLTSEKYIRCPHCYEIASEITIRKRRGKKKDCCYFCDKKIEFNQKELVK